jgi:ubiquinone/menaquinone biosynthesis C-methylase UbiE/uncharacterized membrane protein
MNRAARLTPLDTLRGVLMILMLFEHARQMLSGIVIQETRESIADASIDTLSLMIRSLSHISAPGFFFLLGIGMVLRMRQATSSRHTLNGFFRRGILLVLLQFLVENGAWALPVVLRGSAEGEPKIILYFGVLFALGCSMILSAALWRAPSILLFFLSAILIATSAWNIPEGVVPWVGWLVCGYQGRSVEILYPLLPWTGITLLGIVFARVGIIGVKLQFLKLTRIIGVLAVLVIGMMIASRTFPALFKFYKYPPSILFIGGALLVLLTLLTLFEKVPGVNLPVLQLLGRHALFFYLLHLYVLGFASLIFYEVSMTCILLVASGVLLIIALACWWREASKGLGLFNRFSPWYDRFMQRWGLYHVDAVKQALNPKGPGQSLLDVGGGTGYLASCVADRYARVVVSDLSPGMLRVARSRNLETVEASAMELPFKDEEFDVVLCTDALHHIKEIERALSEMCRVLKPGGTLLIHEFHVQGWKGFFFYWFERLFVDDSVFITPAELQTLLEKRGVSSETQKLSALGYMVVGKRG